MSRYYDRRDEASVHNLVDSKNFLPTVHGTVAQIAEFVDRVGSRSGSPGWQEQKVTIDGVDSPQVDVNVVNETILGVVQRLGAAVESAEFKAPYGSGKDAAIYRVENSSGEPNEMTVTFVATPQGERTMQFRFLQPYEGLTDARIIQQIGGEGGAHLENVEILAATKQDNGANVVTKVKTSAAFVNAE